MTSLPTKRCFTFLACFSVSSAGRGGEAEEEGRGEEGAGGDGGRSKEGTQQDGAGQEGRQHQGRNLPEQVWSHLPFIYVKLQPTSEGIVSSSKHGRINTGAKTKALQQSFSRLIGLWVF